MGKYWKNNRGSSLVEVMAAGVVLMILALLTLQCFSMSAKMMERGRKLKQETEQTVLSLEYGKVPDETEQAQLSLDRPGGTDFGITVTIKRYGSLRVLAGDERQWEGSKEKSDELQNER